MGHDCCGGNHQGGHAPQKMTTAHKDFLNPYTCPMHPEIVQEGPGSCPICGMALEPLHGGSTGPDPELLDMNRRFWVSTILSVIILFLAMGPMVWKAFPLEWMDKSGLWQWILTTPVVLWGGWPLLQKGWASLVNRSLNMFTLIALGVLAAYGFSTVLFLTPQLFDQLLKAHGFYFESAAIITTLVLLGQVLELKARSATGGAIQSLLGLMPYDARLVHPDGREEDVPIESIVPGQTLRIRPGEKIPLDGVVLEGESYVDTALVTGEPIPQFKKSGDPVIGATINGQGSLLMRVEKVGADTLLSQIIHMVQDAQRSKAPIQRLADQVSAYFVPLVILISLITFALWYTIGPEPRGLHGIINGIAVLIIACPCALGLATPMSIMVGIGLGARKGILIKNATALEAMAQIQILVVDKTGTLTEGKPRLVSVLGADGFDPDELLRMAATVEKASEHPIAQAIYEGALDRKITLGTVQNFQTIPGQGSGGVVDGHQIWIGNQALFQGQSIDLLPLKDVAQKRRNQGEIVVYIGLDGRLAGLLSVADIIKKSSYEAVKSLQNQGVKVVMITGDHATTAKIVAQSLGIQTFMADVQPAEKAIKIKEFQAQGFKVAMAGDGVNDAPALSQADIGIAMGHGTDVAIESADVILVQNDLKNIQNACILSKKVMKNIKENLFFAFFYNILGVPVAAGILYPFFGLLLSPILAAAAMSLSSVSVIANALRLRLQIR